MMEIWIFHRNPIGSLGNLQHLQSGLQKKAGLTQGTRPKLSLPGPSDEHANGIRKGEDDGNIIGIYIYIYKYDSVYIYIILMI
jgi:hypothetical protein